MAMSFADTSGTQLDLRQAFQDLPDSRIERNKRHKAGWHGNDLLKVLTLAA
jgi:hypothetical protein